MNLGPCMDYRRILTRFDSGQDIQPFSPRWTMGMPFLWPFAYCVQAQCATWTRNRKDVACKETYKRTRRVTSKGCAEQNDERERVRGCMWIGFIWSTFVYQNRLIYGHRPKQKASKEFTSGSLEQLSAANYTEITHFKMIISKQSSNTISLYMVYTGITCSTLIKKKGQTAIAGKKKRSISCIPYLFVSKSSRIFYFSMWDKDSLIMLK